MTTLSDFYRGKRVLVTGHTGFKGSWLTLWLVELGAEVYGYALEPPTKPSLFEEADIARRMTSHSIGDVRDYRLLSRAVREIQPEIVFHLAAQPLVLYSYQEPRETYETNVMGTVNLLEAVRSVGSVRVCQIITSDKCYENREWTYAYRENDPMGGVDPYSNSKGCAELVVGAYRQSFFHRERLMEHGVSLASVRAGNVIGGGDWATDRLIPDSIRALEKNESVRVRNPQAIRPWQHVLEPLSGYLWLAVCQSNSPIPFADAWNLGPSADGNVTVRQIVEQIIKEWGGGAWASLQTSMPQKMHEATFLKLDTTKAQNRLGWRPLYTIDEAVSATVQWYRFRGKSNKNNLQKFSVDQIQRYTERGRESGVAWSLPVKTVEN
ncbi:MAG: CDP-glucose 4,6-dehydratase [Candidatus Manganitrophus sp. SA1]|nr:CDP-glucose 4,6-dehydratase [Candidatus Manganitrophus morganii]